MKGGSILGWRTVAGVGVKAGWRIDAGVLVRWGLDGFYWTEIVE
jgi:hypothetical protein